ncbi:hypothetical protein NVP1122B_15 [Vibrio phage 1.122.B._10N.286.46.F8]|nr:hypothetical protein NVP1122A_15 [Vibrio phage 1.122.A._10N.286.46.F8]AUR89375.1 hypothetical protein NVP1122B_15 [Vibrio phage 1.122.B._10N.286.46.F8]
MKNGMKYEYKTGQVFETKSYGKAEIVEYVNAYKVIIRFIDTGYVTSVRAECVRTGSIKDKMKPSVHGVGYIGSGPHKPSIGRVEYKKYKVWSAMLQRCYCEKYQKRSPTYIGCKVCDEWHNYQTFCEWFEENYPADGGDYALDKDLGCYGEVGKIYSPDTCVFVTRQVNTEEAHAKSWVAISPEGEIVNIYNLRKFCRDNKIDSPGMHAAMTGKKLEHKGWRKA